MSEELSLVEQHYRNAIDKMSVKERMARSAGMFNWAREFLGRELRKEHPTASEERLKLLMALRTYGSQPTMRQLLEKELERVPD